jgi:hypothetical protein
LLTRGFGFTRCAAHAISPGSIAAVAAIISRARPLHVTEFNIGANIPSNLLQAVRQGDSQDGRDCRLAQLWGVVTCFAYGRFPLQHRFRLSGARRFCSIACRHACIRRSAVIINELGEIAVDHLLVEAPAGNWSCSTMAASAVAPAVISPALHARRFTAFDNVRHFD